MKINLRTLKLKSITLLICLSLINIDTNAQEDKGLLDLKLLQIDSVKTCQAILAVNGKPISEVDVQFYIKRHFSLLPLGAAVKTDEKGIAQVNFPNDIPENLEGKVVVLAKIEDDEKLGSLEDSAECNWGNKQVNHNDEWTERSLSASREKAPWLLMITSYSIILAIWGTIIYVIYQLYVIKHIRTNK